MGCSNSKQGEEPDADRVAVKPLNHYQISAPSTTSNIFHDFDSIPFEAIAQTRQFVEDQFPMPADTTVDADAFEETKEFEAALMEMTSEIFEEQYGNPNWIPVATTFDPTPEPNAKKERVEECFMCCQPASEDVFMSYPCRRCASPTCNTCIKSMFTSACVDESRMPPRCCVPLNVGAAVKALTPEEMERFKNKHEEWRTANRVYCPVPTCSAFIPYRLFPSEYRPTTAKPAKPKAKEVPPEIPGPTQLQTPPPTPPKSSSSPPPQPAFISCPGCAIEICCACKQLAHSGAPCAENAGELDPELTALLEKWNIKRCPKCRGAVRRMYGCSHMACRCGDQWCWHCTQSIEVCNQQGCPNSPPHDEDDYEEDEDDDDDSENENEAGNEERRDPAPLDLDRRTAYNWEDYDFGEEPVLERYNPFDCNHTWIKVIAERTNEKTNFACENCWRDISPRPIAYPEVTELLEHGFISEKPMIGEGKPELRLFMCERCELSVCDDCHAADKADKAATMRRERE